MLEFFLGEAETPTSHLQSPWVDIIDLVPLNVHLEVNGYFFGV